MPLFAPSGQPVTSPDNMPGVYTPPPPPVAAPVAPSLPLPSDLSAVQTHAVTHDHASREFERWRAQLPASDLPVRGREFESTPAARSADAAVDGLRARRDQVAAGIAKARAGLKVPTSDVAAQIASQRWWSRTKPVLDRLAGGPLTDAVRNIVAGADAATLGAAAEELGPYLTTRGLNPDVIVEPALAAKLPGSAELSTAVTNLTKAVQIAEQNQRSLHASYDKGTIPAPRIDASKYDADAVHS